jgi:hypothetical protein
MTATKRRLSLQKEEVMMLPSNKLIDIIDLENEVDIISEIIKEVQMKEAIKVFLIMAVNCYIAYKHGYEQGKDDGELSGYLKGVKKGYQLGGKDAKN